MSATLLNLFVKVRSEKGSSNFSSASGNVGIFHLETPQKEVAWMFLISDTAVTEAHFNNFDDGEDLPILSFLGDKTTGMIYVLTAADTWTELGEVT